jgi:release factor glutamine methyltransferase
MNISEALKEATSQLQLISDSARLDAELLMAFCLKCPRTYLYSHSDEELSNEEASFWNLLIQKRLSSIPIAYLIGQKEFWSIPLQISIDTLIPRPATEALIEYVLEFYAKHSEINVCDLGTGSGAIAIALAKERPRWHIQAIDIHANTLAEARHNANINHCNHIEFICSNWFQKLAEYQFDLIISNPPYIDANDPHLNQGDVQHEPKRALISPKQGYQDLEHLISESLKHLKSNGQLILEHGYEQQAEVARLMQTYGLTEIKTYSDHEGQPRFCVGFKE